MTGFRCAKCNGAIEHRCTPKDLTISTLTSGAVDIREPQGQPKPSAPNGEDSGVINELCAAIRWLDWSYGCQGCSGVHMHCEMWRDGKNEEVFTPQAKKYARLLVDVIEDNLINVHVAQLVERRSENPKAAGANPAVDTFKPFRAWVAWHPILGVIDRTMRKERRDSHYQLGCEMPGASEGDTLDCATASIRNGWRVVEVEVRAVEK